MSNSLKRPFSTVASIFVGLFACALINAGFIALHILSLISLTSWTYLFVVILSFVAFTIIAYFLAVRNITDLFCLTKIKGQLTLSMRAKLFINTGKLHPESNTIIGLILLKDFLIAAQTVAAEHHAGTQFVTKTWIFDERGIERLKKRGYRAEKITFSIFSRFLIGFAAYLAHNTWDVWNKVKGAQFYKISFTDEVVLDNKYKEGE